MEATYFIRNLKIEIDEESVDIYVDNGDDEEPTHVCYWHLDEVEEDANVAISIANAVKLAYTDPLYLYNRIYKPANHDS